ncbi:HAMP domain-containing sensor histidine kinase [soil metagenome]
MTRQGSLRLRLFVAAAISIIIALALAGLGLRYVFERHVERRIEDELHGHLLQLAATIEVTPAGKLAVPRALADPRFMQPLSGLYWQIDLGGQDIARSKSLWDERLKVPTPPSGPQDVHTHLLEGPDGTKLFAQERFAVMHVAGEDQPLVLTAAIDNAEIDNAVADFTQDLTISLAGLGAVLILAAWLQVTIGLVPMRQLTKNLARIRAGGAESLAGPFPDEVTPLADEFNAVLDAQKKSLARARERAGNLAHGLKTPLTVLGAVARDIRAGGAERIAADIDEQVRIMQAHIDRELARARLSLGHAVTALPLKPRVARVIKAMRLSPRGDAIGWIDAVPDEAAIAMEEQDLTELLGNLLDNARLWAGSMVRIAYDGGTLVIEDDGPGIPDTDYEHVLERGGRLDESVPGSGLGLAIARDIAEVYGLSLTLSASELGGLKVSVGRKPPV